MLFAYTIVLAHSIIPHHHHDDHKMEQSSDQRHSDSEHHGMQGEEGLAHQFGNYMHSVNAADVYQRPDVPNDQNLVAGLDVFITLFIKMSVVEVSQTVVRLSNDCIPLSQHFLFIKGLRAPPATLI